MLIQYDQRHATGDAVAVTTTWQLEKGELEAIAAVVGEGVLTSDIVTISRAYGHEPKIEPTLNNEAAVEFLYSKFKPRRLRAIGTQRRGHDYCTHRGVAQAYITNGKAPAIAGLPWTGWFGHSPGHCADQGRMPNLCTSPPMSGWTEPSRSSTLRL
jgi:hypothetical protein